MENDLQLIIDELVALHGKDKIHAATEASTAVDPPKCPVGQYWNGTACVDNVG